MLNTKIYCFLEALSKKFKEILVIAGNHDEYLEEFVDPVKLKPKTKKPPLSHCTYLLNSSVTISGVKFYGSPWVPVFRQWAFQLKRGQQLDDNWKQIPSDTDVLITHTPPLGVLDLSAHHLRAGCLSLLGHVVTRVQPRYHIFGHIHESYGILKTSNTTFINAATCDKSYRARNAPVVFDIPISGGFSKESQRELERDFKNLGISSNL